MCLGVPGRVVEVKDNGIAVVEFSNGVTIETDANTIEGIQPGDHVIVHAGIIISKLTIEQMEEWARDIRDFIRELEEKESEIIEMLEGLREGDIAEESGED